MYVCMSENLYPARLKQKVTVAPRSQTNRNVFSAKNTGETMTWKAERVEVVTMTEMVITFEVDN